MVCIDDLVPKGHILKDIDNAKVDNTNTIQWKAYSNGFSIQPTNDYVIYAKITNKVGNSVIINYDGIVIENVVHQISRITDGKTYCSSVDAIATDDNIDTITLNGEMIMPEGGKFTISPKAGTQTIVVTGKACYFVRA